MLDTLPPELVELIHAHAAALSIQRAARAARRREAQRRAARAVARYIESFSFGSQEAFASVRDAWEGDVTFWRTYEPDVTP